MDNSTAVNDKNAMAILYDFVLPWLLMLSFVGLVLAAPAGNQHASLPTVASPPPTPPESGPPPSVVIGNPGLKTPGHGKGTPSSPKLDASKKPATPPSQNLYPPALPQPPPLPHKLSKRGEDASGIKSIEPHLHEALGRLHDQLAKMDPMAKTKEQMEQKGKKQFDKKDQKKAEKLVNDVKYYSEEMARAVKKEYDQKDPSHAAIERGKAEVRRANYQIDRVEKLIGKVG